MPVHHQQLTIRTSGKGLYELTRDVASRVAQECSGDGLATIFCTHTSCSLVLMENADPTARADLERYMDRLVPENDPQFTHTLEGADDMPSHIRMALTRSSETIPVINGQLALGTWQGLFLWEHRRQPHQRTLILSVH